MQFEEAYIPYGAYWSTPFCKWQGSFASKEPIPFAAEVARKIMEERGISPELFDGACLGYTVPSRHSFYGGPWFTAMAGLGSLPAPIISQACATGVRCIIYGVKEVISGSASALLAVTADRCSNGPHLYYPNPGGPGGTGKSEDWVMDNFGHDPWARNAMIQTAENAAAEAGIDREIQDRVALMRFQQYQNALQDDAAFQKRYMISPIDVTDSRGRKVLATVTSDEGVFPTTAEGLARLRPVMKGGTVTFGAQTYPADGNAAVVITNKDMAREFSRDSSIEVRVVAEAQARVKKGYMPMANAPAVRMALSRAGIGVGDLKAMTSHTPFAVNDVYLSRELGIPLEDMNRYGCSLVWGHPQAPTGMRGVIELIEELAMLGGGYGVFTGCAAGDSASALVVKVN